MLYTISVQKAPLALTFSPLQTLYLLGEQNISKRLLKNNEIWYKSSLIYSSCNIINLSAPTIINFVYIPVVLTPRQEQLVYSKRLHPNYQGDRHTPIWPVSPNALRATASKRITQLAESKRVHSKYQPPKGVSLKINDEPFYIDT